MNTEIIVHPKLQHVGLTTPNLDALLDWYRETIGLTVNHLVKVPPGLPHPPPFTAVAFASNDEVNHRISIFEMPGLSIDRDRLRHAKVQHIAFTYKNLDDLLGTYVRLKNKDIRPEWAADQFFQTAIYYQDPDLNTLELNVNNFDDEWTVTEQLKLLPTEQTLSYIDPDKMIEARKAGASAWQLHERAYAGEFKPAKPYDLGGSY
jgi:catechol 2,3-dioxygenase